MTGYSYPNHEMPHSSDHNLAKKHLVAPMLAVSHPPDIASPIVAQVGSLTYIDKLIGNRVGASSPHCSIMTLAER